MKLKKILPIVLICITIVMNGCAQQVSKNRIIRDFENNKEAFEYVADYVRDFDLSKYETEANTDLPLFVDFVASDFESGKAFLTVSAGWAPTVFDRSIEIDGEIKRAASEIFNLNYAYIGQIAVSKGGPLVIYFRIDDIKKPETDVPHGIAYTSDNLPPIIENDDRGIKYTEQISEHWFYYENNTLNEYDELRKLQR